MIERFREQVSAAAANGAKLRIRGGGTKDWYGQSFAGEILDTRAYAGIVDDEPTAFDPAHIFNPGRVY